MAEGLGKVTFMIHPGKGYGLSIWTKDKVLTERFIAACYQQYNEDKENRVKSSGMFWQSGSDRPPCDGENYHFFEFWTDKETAVAFSKKVETRMGINFNWVL